MNAGMEQPINQAGRKYGQFQREQDAMGFVNEYVSEEDIKKYKLDEAFLKRNPAYKYGGIPSSFRHHWTVDHARNIYLMRVITPGRDFEPPWQGFLLDWDGKEFLCKLEYGPGRSSKYSETPFVIVWSLLGIDPDHLHHMQREQVVEVLKEALTVFGSAGITHQVPNTIVKFTF